MTTRSDRDAIRRILANSSAWDADTLRIHRDGTVTARKDANKTFSPDNMRYLVGCARDILSDDALDSA